MSELITSGLTFTPAAMHRLLMDLQQELAVVQRDGKLGLSTDDLDQLPASVKAIAVLPSVKPEQFGDNNFCQSYKTRYAYMTGAMANGIASAELVIAMGKSGLLASYGAGGVLPQKVEEDVIKIKNALGAQPFAVNLIHSPHEPLMEQRCVDIFLKHGVSVVEASAFMDITLPLVYYRVAGVFCDSLGQVSSSNRVIAKVSRPEVAQRFMSSAPSAMIELLLQQGRITSSQAELAKRLPIADDITVEADSGGHTDRRPLTALLPIILTMRDQHQEQSPDSVRLRIGAAGGIGTAESALAAFSMGADYIVTGSVNQSCVESGSCDDVRKLLAQANFTDVDMAPAADMFEMGVQLQVLKRGTFFPMRAKHLYEIYQTYSGLEAIPTDIYEKLETQIFKRSLKQVWQETCDYFSQRDPAQIARAQNDPKRKMALVFRSYLGQSSSWAKNGVKDRVMDYQIWTGPAMGAFNHWVLGSYLEQPANRKVVDVAEHIMLGCAFYQRIHLLRMQGVYLGREPSRYVIATLAQGAQGVA
jgi:trans-AT polyketide synthase, acyltransferase and oxidoreductase domains